MHLFVNIKKLLHENLALDTCYSFRNTIYPKKITISYLDHTK